MTAGDGSDHRTDRSAGPVGVVCVDDNRHVAEAVRIKMERAGGFVWKGWLPTADQMVPTVRRECPQVVILDVDMPGRDPFEATAELVDHCPDTRVVMFSGHVREELVARALDSGAWGYVSKNDGEEALILAIRSVMAGELALSPEVRAAYWPGASGG